MSREPEPESPNLREIATRLAVAMVSAGRGTWVPAKIPHNAATLAGKLLDEAARVERERVARQCFGCSEQAVHLDVHDDPVIGAVQCCGSRDCCSASEEGWKEKPLKGAAP